LLRGILNAAQGAIVAGTNAGCPNTLAVNQTTSTDLHTMSATGYICSIVLVSASQQGISINEGTGSVCGTGTAYLLGGSGGTTQVAANGGFSATSFMPIIQMKVSADHLCLIQSGAGNVSGFITYSDH
jgi:hypothetical protein